ncbi:ATP-binding response regulator [Mangrovihabitans endophyticus]|uniref:histidine kinase n=1 Tax=Mangrovihabitans endophyticus TaxID=1751298 RepID=A0A8J3FNL8_9ACTN|nr:response regulator [Mangrovihabitans endophyticus]GGK94228.1 histidine kinase [Mangrovihabitans endophyticus]
MSDNTYEGQIFSRVFSRADTIRLLLVEDNPGDVQLIAEHLSTIAEFSFDLHRVGRMAAIDAAFGAGEFDAILLDLNLPDSTGITSLQTLRRTHPEKPIVVLSGMVDDEIRRQAFAEGASDVIDKNDAGRGALARSVLYAIARTRIQRPADPDAGSVLDVDPSAVIVTDLQGKVSFANDAAARFFGCDSGDLVGSELGIATEDGETVEIDAIADGQRRVGEMRSVRVGWRDEQSVLNVVRDVTEQRLLREQLNEAQKFEALGRLAGGVAHSFNNMLAVLMTAVDLLYDAVEDCGPAVPILGQVERASQRAAAITRQLLIFSQSSRAKPVPVPLNDLVREDITLLGRLIGADIAIEAHLDDMVGSVWVDPVQLEQVIMNLVLNARDALPNGGTITLETRPIDLVDKNVHDLAPGRYASITVQDDGTGMSEKVKAHVFEPFFTTKTPEAGAGLGLSTAYGIVSQASGAIAVASELGEGTTFTILLPADAPEVEDEPADTDHRVALPSGSGTVMVVEDEADLRHIICHSLMGAGYDVVEAADGLEALRVVATGETPIDLLLTDVVMPGLGGYRLAERMDKRHPGLRVIFMSGYADVTAHVPKLTGPNAFLDKPFGQRALLGLIRDVMSLSSGAT